MLNTQTLHEVLRLKPDAHYLELGQRCGEDPWFWRWFCSEQVAERMADWSASRDRNAWAQWRQPPRSSNQPGQCVVWAVLKPAWEFPSAAPSVGLPLVWRSEPHCPRIPAPLRVTADQVKTRLSASPTLRERLGEGSLRADDWGIHWGIKPWERADLSNLNVEPQSAWAPLATGLVSAVLNKALHDDLFVSGWWNESTGRWTLDVDSLIKKLETGVNWQRHRFAVPADCLATAQGYLFGRLGRDHVQCVDLRDEPNDLAIAVRRATVMGGMEPEVDDPHACVGYYLDLPTTDMSRKFYREKLLDEIAAVQAAKIRAEPLLGHWQPRQLVSIVSHAPELIQLAIKTFRPRVCHLVHTRDRMAQEYKHVRDWAEALNQHLPKDQRIELNAHPVDDTVAAISQQAAVVSGIERSGEPGELLIDSTPGRRAMQMALLQGAERGDRVLCWWHRTDRHTRRAIPFSEEPLLWEVTSDRGLVPIFQSRTGD